MQLPNEQGVSKGGMQSHFGMRIRHDIVKTYLSGALFNRWLNWYLNNKHPQIFANLRVFCLLDG
jgi:hypothetical protein